MSKLPNIRDFFKKKVQNVVEEREQQTDDASE